MMYEQLPQLISPVALMLGGFQLHWYGLAWIVAFGVVWMLLVWRLHRGEAQALCGLTREMIGDVIALALMGAVIGGRLGYALFYNFTFFAQNPLAIIWPFVDGQFMGISGMSFHGGVIGVVFALWIVAQRQKWSFFSLVDFIVPAVPLGYMFGRIGNFLNHELWGRETLSAAGMYFVGAPDGGTLLRHPSQLYEAFFEGAILFCVLWILRNHFISKTCKTGVLTGLFLVGYSLARFGVEFFRAPDAHLGVLLFSLSMGQLLSVFMGTVGVCIILWTWLCNKRMYKATSHTLL